MLFKLFSSNVYNYFSISTSAIPNFPQWTYSNTKKYTITIIETNTRTGSHVLNTNLSPSQSIPKDIQFQAQFSNFVHSIHLKLGPTGLQVPFDLAWSLFFVGWVSSRLKYHACLSRSSLIIYHIYSYVYSLLYKYVYSISSNLLLPP